MIRTSAPTWLAFGLATLVASTGSAEPTSTTTTDPEGSPAVTGERVAVPTPQEAFVTRPHAAISQILFMNRCNNGGCPVNPGEINDARSNTSTIPSGSGPYTVAEFQG